MKSAPAQRAHREGLVHHGVELAFGGARHRIDMHASTGKTVMIYGQTEVTLDLMNARKAAGLTTIYQAADVKPHDFDTDHPRVSLSRTASATRSPAISLPAATGSTASAAPASSLRRSRPSSGSIRSAGSASCRRRRRSANELIYTNHARGFALCTMRSTHRSRYYVQCPLDDHIDQWPDERFWDELKRRLDQKAVDELVTGPSIEKSIAPLRSFVAEPMRFGRMFLAGDAAHIVPPTGAKGLNLAASDVHYLSQALARILRREILRRHRRLFRNRAGAGLEGGALFVVDDLDAAQISRPGRIRRANSAGRTELSRQLESGDDVAVGKLRRIAVLADVDATSAKLSDHLAVAGCFFLEDGKRASRFKRAAQNLVLNFVVGAFRVGIAFNGGTFRQRPEHRT